MCSFTPRLWVSAVRIESMNLDEKLRQLKKASAAARP